MKEYPLSSIKDLLPAVELPAKANKPSAISFKDVENVAFGPVGEPAGMFQWVWLSIETCLHFVFIFLFLRCYRGTR